MTHQIYTLQQLQSKSLSELKTLYRHIGASVKVADKRFKSAWANAIVAHQSSQVQKVKKLAVAVAQEAAVISPLPEWDCTIPKWSTPAAICPDCNGHGCGNCNYRGTRAVDLCTPVDEYRLQYLAKTDTQTAYNAYNQGVPLGILFKVRNSEEVWENAPTTYYWQCGHDVKYWSVKEAIVALEKLTSLPKKRASSIEVPAESMELLAA
ncbi:hypothetical protein [Nostoc sp. TCL240-02]|uniref:hypothetical protein n=1 Tax=Nostoc sp. TCL240-02 TaxID=2572090 RepID=UPI00157FA53B|nr:hypothetical protein [Nostoc sp. TCL240-02]QKQ75612.1 hypothetical protein FBB35_22035 [Nostoc sp. TCL240-02]